MTARELPRAQILRERYSVLPRFARCVREFPLSKSKKPRPAQDLSSGQWRSLSQLGWSPRFVSDPRDSFWNGEFLRPKARRDRVYMCHPGSHGGLTVMAGICADLDETIRMPLSAKALRSAWPYQGHVSPKPYESLYSLRNAASGSQTPSSNLLFHHKSSIHIIGGMPKPKLLRGLYLAVTGASRRKGEW